MELTMVSDTATGDDSAGQPPGEVRLATRGLATVALLKVNFDAGRDHIGMFEPFVLDTISSTEIDVFSAEAMRDAVRTRHQFTLPLNALRTLLGRAVTGGYLRREAGRYFKTDRQPDVGDLQVARRQVEQRQQQLAEAFRVASAPLGVDIATTEDALAILLRFFDQYHVALALGREGGLVAPLQPPDGGDADEPQRRTVAAATFLRDTVLNKADLAAVVQEMLEGFVLQNTLLLKDISTASRRFNNLHVIFDSGLLFEALGMRGTASQTATTELLSLLSDTGAILDVFEPTIREMRRILAVYEDKIGTPEGRASLFPVELTRHFLTTKATPSDIRTQSALLERNIRNLGFNIRDIPTRTEAWTLNESALGQLLAKEPGAENVPRVLHDIDCVAGALTYRRGATADSYDNAVAVFVTSSGMTVRHVANWYREQGGRGVPPIIHVLGLSNFAWLKKPVSASKLKLHELVALCSAALRPSREAWSAFLAHLEALEASGELSSDEVTAIVASGLTDQLLVTEEIGEDSDASTLTEVVERVKQSYSIRLVAEIEAANEATRASDERVTRLHNKLERRVRTIGSAISWTLASLFGLSVITGAVLSIIDAAAGTRPKTVELVLAVTPLAIAGLCGVLWGFHLKAWRRATADWIQKKLMNWLSDGAAL
jgi:hypothetical protein